ncbi:MAG: hypothetical protein KF688_01825 [Pirellulales bacterium]|nr:hypothetical protein [Pirellulales bacterium]
MTLAHRASHRILLTVALVAIVASTSSVRAATPAKTKYALAYKFKMGEVLRYQVEHATNVRTTIDGKTQQTESLSESTKAWKVTDVLPDGEMEFVHLVESVRMTNDTPGGPSHSYDSAKDSSPPPGFEGVAAAVNVPISVVRISPSGEVVSREEKHPQPVASKDMPITLPLPAQPIAVGERWSNVYDVPAERKGGAKIAVRTRRICKLVAVKNGVATISVEYNILTPVDPFVRSQLVDRLTTGKVRFDLEAGRIVEQRHSGDTRVLGFAGQASSMHFASRFEERLLPVDSDAVSKASHTTTK